VGHVESCFGLFGDSISVYARYLHALRHTYPGLRKSFWTQPMVLQGDHAVVDDHFGLIGDSANLDVR
jgi:hypothetical protein